MRLSTHDQPTGTVTAVTLGSVMATVEVDVGGQWKEPLVPHPSLRSGRAPTRGPAAVVVLVTSTEVVLGVEDRGRTRRPHPRSTRGGTPRGAAVRGRRR